MGAGDNLKRLDGCRGAGLPLSLRHGTGGSVTKEEDEHL